MSGPTWEAAILDRVGNTPLIRIDGLDDRIRDVAVLGKAVWVNPGGSVKDRAAKARGKWLRTIQMSIGTPTNIQTPITGARVIELRRMKSGSRPKAE